MGQLAMNLKNISKFLFSKKDLNVWIIPVLIFGAILQKGEFPHMNEETAISYLTNMCIF